MNQIDPFSNDPLFNDPELEAMGREFKRILREEQEEIEAISAESLESEIDLSFAFLELMWSGAQTRVAIGDRFFEGQVFHVGKNVVQMTTSPGTVADIHLPFVASVFVVERGSTKGRSMIQRDPRTFAARMRELVEFPMQEVELGDGKGQSGISGILKIVRSDHLVVTNREKKEWLIPFNQIGYCITRSKR